MKLSYIIPVYKVENYLSQCVDSILEQSMDNYEIILVDDGSPDNCPEICDEYKRKYPDIVKVIHKKNGGLANARNAGMKIASGEYIFFFDSDDYLISNNVKTLYEEAVEHNADVLHTSYISINERNGETLKSKLPLINGKVYSHDEMGKEICFASSKALMTFVWRNLYRRQFLIDNGIRFEDSLRMVEDSPFNFLAFGAAERFLAVDIPVYCYRIRQDSLQRQKYVADYDIIIEKQWKLKLKYYQQFFEPSEVFYRDIGEYTVKAILPLLLRNVYINNIRERFSLLKRIAKSEMMLKSFQDYDINEFKSKSLDWIMTYLIKHKLYFLAHLVCEFFLFKD
jgi:glycosyltransferase involved in cell wall biosynthesis